ncbi:MAG: tRNA uridine-5-carboxymethylaminomethyl(34) synthesis GTPase MnmE [Pseudomonadota bacterium]
MSGTIYASSSGQPPAAIAVVRISGPAAGEALCALAGRMPTPRRASLRTLTDPATGAPLDQALTLWFPGPATATGEDMAELHLHGGRAVVAAVLAALAHVPGLRAAEAGEFTRRAFANGRIDLAEAEGLADLLAAETESQRVAALAAASGHVSRRVAAWQGEILTLAAEVEALLDFGDEDDVAGHAAAVLPLCSRCRACADTMRIWLARPAAERIRDGLSVVVAGPPNAGKSTLINALAQREAAIVAPTAGTTRDIVEVPLQLDGIAMRFADTAGLRRTTGDAIEAIGIERARQAIDMADILLWLGAIDDAPDHPHRLTIAAQADRFAGDAGWAATAARADLILSAHSGAGMTDLHAQVVQIARTLIPHAGEAALHARQRAALAEAADWLAQDEQDGDLVLLAERLRLARVALDRITGRAGVEDMLDTLFGRFCIGK